MEPHIPITADAIVGKGPRLCAAATNLADAGQVRQCFVILFRQERRARCQLIGTTQRQISGA